MDVLLSFGCGWLILGGGTTRNKSISCAQASNNTTLVLVDFSSFFVGYLGRPEQAQDVLSPGVMLSQSPEVPHNPPKSRLTEKPPQWQPPKACYELEHGSQNSSSASVLGNLWQFRLPRKTPLVLSLARQQFCFHISKIRRNQEINSFFLKKMR